MLFWKDSKSSHEQNSTVVPASLELGFSLSPITINQYNLYVIYTVLAILLITGLWLYPDNLLVWVIFIIVAIEQWRYIAALKHPKSIIKLFCLQGSWSCKQLNGQLIENLYITHYFISAHFLVVHFRLQPIADSGQSSRDAVYNKNQARNRIEKLQDFFKGKRGGRFSLMMFPAQLGEENYRSLFRSLKYRDKRLTGVVPNVVAKKDKKRALKV